jgi:predicted  nucleic acid-binding Zn-ribbon protein
MFPFSKKKPLKTDEEIAKEREDNLERMFQDSLKLMKLVSIKGNGWEEFVSLLDDYIKKAQDRKLKTRLDLADEKTIEQLKLLDHEIYILTWVKNMPGQFINMIEEGRKPKEE